MTDLTAEETEKFATRKKEMFGEISSIAEIIIEKQEMEKKLEPFKNNSLSLQDLKNQIEEKINFYKQNPFKDKYGNFKKQKLFIFQNIKFH